MDYYDYYDDDLDYDSEDNDLEEKLLRYKSLIKTKKIDELFLDSEDIEDLVYYCIENNNILDALDFVKVWLNISPFSSEAWQMKGYIFFLLGFYHEALRYLNKSLMLNPNDTMTLFYKASTFQSMLRYKKAISVLEKILAMEPDNEEALYRKALLLEYIKDYKSAINILKFLLKTEYYSKNATIELAYCYHYLGKYRLALDYYQKAIDLEPYDEELWINKAHIHSNLGQRYVAIDCLDMAIAINKTNIDAIYFKGNLLKKLGKLKEALDCYKEGLQIKPNGISFLYSIANLLTDMKEYKSAIDYYSIVIGLNPDHFSSYFGRGICYDILDYKDLALQDYENALKINNRSPEIWQAKADLLYNMSRRVEAVQCYEKALYYKPNNISCLIDYAITLYEIGDGIKAEKTFLKIIQLSIYNTKAHLYLAKLYSIFGYHDLSYKYLLTAILISSSEKDSFIKDYLETALLCQPYKHYENFLRILNSIIK